MKKAFIISLLSVLLHPLGASAQKEAYAVYTDDGTLTFYYDNLKNSREGTAYELNHEYDNPGWYTEHVNEITKAVFDASFAEARPVSTRYWFAGDYNYDTWEVESSFTEIQDIKYLNTSKVASMAYMFYGCKYLTSLDVSGFDTSNVYEMSHMFNNCSGLTSLDVSNFDTRNVGSMGEMFCDCSALTSLDVSGFNTSKVVDIGYMFSGCSGLTSIDVSKFDTSNVSYMSGMFQGCSGLTSLDVRGFDTSKVVDIGFLFSGCSGLTSIDVSNFDTSNVTYMAAMFQSCSGLTSLDITNFDTSKVTTFYFMFSGCYQLSNIDLSNFNTSNVKDMECMFQDCIGLTSLDLRGFDTGNVTVMDNMFWYCTNLTILDLSGFDTKKVTNMSEMFGYCSHLVTIYSGDGWNMDNVITSNDMFYQCESLVGSQGTTFDPECTDGNYAHADGGPSNPGYFTYLDLPIEAYAVYTDNGTLTFYYDTQKSSRNGTVYELNEGGNEPGWYTEHAADITKAVFENSFAAARPTSTAYWFAGKWVNGDNKSVVDFVNFENLNTSQVTNMSYMFHYSKVRSLDLSGFDTRNVTDMKKTFALCRDLESINLSGWDTHNVKDMSFLFEFCEEGLTSLDLSGFDTGNVTNMNDMFYACSNLKSINLNGWDTKNVTNMESMFSCCESLESIDVSSFDTSNVTNMMDMFLGCSSLTSLDVSGFNTQKVEYLHAMFSSCSNLKTLDVSGFDTNSIAAPYYVFSKCSSLTTIYCGEKWVSHPWWLNEMFEGCVSLVGGKGTTFDPEHIDGTYAHADGGPSNPGYLTLKVSTPTAISIDNNTTEQAEKVYDLQGRRANDTARKGIYIVNGKKVVR